MRAIVGFIGFAGLLGLLYKASRCTVTFLRVVRNFIFGLIIRACKKVRFGRLRQALSEPLTSHARLGSC